MNWHYCEACGYDAPSSALNGYMCCWLMNEEERLELKDMTEAVE